MCSSTARDMAASTEPGSGTRPISALSKAQAWPFEPPGSVQNTCSTSIALPFDCFIDCQATPHNDSVLDCESASRDCACGSAPHALLLFSLRDLGDATSESLNADE